MSGDAVRVYIADDYYEHEHFGTEPQTWWGEKDVYDVPREQVERWQAAQDAWQAAQGEMAALMDERRRRRKCPTPWPFSPPPSMRRSETPKRQAPTARPSGPLAATTR